MLILLHPHLPQRTHSKQLSLWRQDVCQSASHQQDVTGLCFGVTEEAAAPRPSSLQLLAGHRREPALSYNPARWSLEFICGTRATRYVSYKEYDCSPGKGWKGDATAAREALHVRGQQKLMLLTTRHSSGASTTQKPLTIHCTSLQIWTLYFCLPTVWTPTAHMATQPLSLVPGPNRDDTGSRRLQRHAYKPDDGPRGCHSWRLTSAPIIPLRCT